MATTRSTSRKKNSKDFDYKQKQDLSIMKNPQVLNSETDHIDDDMDMVVGHNNRNSIGPTSEGSVSVDSGALLENSLLASILNAIENDAEDSELFTALSQEINDELLSYIPIWERLPICIVSKHWKTTITVMSVELLQVTLNTIIDHVWKHSTEIHNLPIEVSLDFLELEQSLETGQDRSHMCHIVRLVRSIPELSDHTSNLWQLNRGLFDFLETSGDIFARYEHSRDTDDIMGSGYDASLYQNATGSYNASSGDDYLATESSADDSYSGESTADADDIAMTFTSLPEVIHDAIVAYIPTVERLPLFSVSIQL